MGLIKTMVFHDDAYHKIMSVEFHREKRQLRIRIRTDVFVDKEKQKPLVSREYTINEKILINGSTGAAERAISPKEIKKIANEEIAGVEKDLERGKTLPKAEQDKIVQTIRFSLIAEKKKEIGKNKMAAIVDGINKRSVLSVAYDCLKMLGEFVGAVDA